MRVIEVTRSAKSHKLNERSSRSHCVVTFNMSRKTGNKLTSSKFTFCDLAGSERIKKSMGENYDENDKRAAEAKNINTSLTTLGRVILALKKKQAMVPFRESALTMLMKSSLSGNCRTALVVAVSESPEMMSESQSTLRFGVTCGALQTKTVSTEVNVDSQMSSLRG